MSGDSVDDEVLASGEAISATVGGLVLMMTGGLVDRVCEAV